MLKLHNTLTGKTEEFVSITPNKVGMYNCGPTVYDHAHIGNLRSYVMANIIYRTLSCLGYEVTQVMNITDVGIGGDNDEGEDKIIRGLKREGKEISIAAMKDLTDFYTDAFIVDLERLNIDTPTHLPRASEHIAHDIELIETLIKKGFAYITSDGVYFDTSKDEHYGKLGGHTSDENREARVESTHEKKNPKDFSLWKLNSSVGFESPWGTGFPGWHIECSAMSHQYLGAHFDIHTGGIDLAPIHHNNEITQSENAFDEPYVNYWIHNAFVNVENGKMAKSTGNFITLTTLIEKNILPLSYRYWLLQARYSTPVNFSFEALEAAEQAYLKLLRTVRSYGEHGTVDEHYKDRFTSFIEDDLDTPQVLALIWELTKDIKVDPENKRATILEFDKILGLNLKHTTIPSTIIDTQDIPMDIRELITQREEARKNKDFNASDAIRNKILEQGFLIEDKPEGPQISRSL